MSGDRNRRQMTSYETTMHLASLAAALLQDDEFRHAYAVRTAEHHANVYFNILCSANPKNLRLTPHHNEIYLMFRKEFPDLNIMTIDDEDMKDNKWESFCEHFKYKVKDYDFDTYLRIEYSGDYAKENTTVVTRIQFYAIELARNKEGLNSIIQKKFKPKPVIKFKF